MKQSGEEEGKEDGGAGRAEGLTTEQPPTFSATIRCSASSLPHSAPPAKSAGQRLLQSLFSVDIFRPRGCGWGIGWGASGAELRLQKLGKSNGRETQERAAAAADWLPLWQSHLLCVVWLAVHMLAHDACPLLRARAADGTVASSRCPPAELESIVGEQSWRACRAGFAPPAPGMAQRLLALPQHRQSRSCATQTPSDQLVSVTLVRLLARSASHLVLLSPRVPEPGPGLLGVSLSPRLRHRAQTATLLR